MPELARDELIRYARHLTLPEVGEAGQERLRDASVAIVGVGGLGSPLALYLAAAGVGRIGLIEFDKVDLTNLQRQILYATPQVGRDKLESARARLRAVNPHVRVETHATRLGPGDAVEILGQYDAVADGADNFATRYLVNDACVLLGKPDVQGSVLRFEGQISVFDATRGPCYRCLFPEPPAPGSVPSCSEAGVLGVLPGVIGSLQAAEVLKLLLGIGTPLIGRLLIFDGLRAEFRELRLEKNPDCPACGPRARRRDPGTIPGGLAPATDGPVASCADPAGAPATGRSPGTLTSGWPHSETPATTLPAWTPPPAAPPSQSREVPAGPFDPSRLAVSPEEVKACLVRGDPILLLDVREPFEVRICALGGSVHIPLRRLPARYPDLDPGSAIVAICHIGARSLEAVRFLRSRGRARSWSLAGGIDAWARTIEPGMPRY